MYSTDEIYDAMREAVAWSRKNAIPGNPASIRRLARIVEWYDNLLQDDVCPTCGCKRGEEPYDKRWCVDGWHDTNVICPTCNGLGCGDCTNEDDPKEDR